MDNAAFERIPPQNLEAERAVLASMMLEKDAIYEAIQMIKPKDFYKEAHSIIFSAIIDLTEKGEPVDLITLTEQLRQESNLEKIGGVGYIAEVANSVGTAASIVHYARLVRDKSLLRTLIRTATNIATRGYEPGEEPEELLDDAERMVLEVSQNRIRSGLVPITDVIENTIEKLELLQQQKSDITGLSSGFRDLDAMTSGWHSSDLVIVAARPAMGKTSFCLNIAQHAGIKENVPVAIFSLEMSREQLVLRMLSSLAMLDQQKLRTGRMIDKDWISLTNAIGPLAEAPIYIDDTPGISVMEIRAKTRRLKAEKGLGLIVIDYLQLMSSGRRSESRQQEISEISRNLKALARELEVPIIALSQLSRAVEQTQDKRPGLSHLRESGALEQDADIVMFIFREEYYNPESDKKAIAEIIIAKHRNGPVGSVELAFLKEFTKFADLAKMAE
ncbi:primary replicative DNA helicase [Desulfonispora thiosulfatigenes DSM 11270]|uniref:Replicative DNA helicase n=1 Tax=Desulfonispora thiosulfatigenes DSM 11270 TaxID=656914 RepID=A0A1W1V339_DESTI|nr:replicative DNA helicase [Desulfonispora thiosulfatigenes]SMB87718.1 primary replicative DNA helicase [Desulfonispora thiosulfatigenes DSM 11270]